MSPNAQMPPSAIVVKGESSAARAVGRDALARAKTAINSPGNVRSLLARTPASAIAPNVNHVATQGQRTPGALEMATPPAATPPKVSALPHCIAERCTSGTFRLLRRPRTISRLSCATKKLAAENVNAIADNVHFPAMRAVARGKATAPYAPCSLGNGGPRRGAADSDGFTEGLMPHVVSDTFDGDARGACHRAGAEVSPPPC